MTTVDLDDDDHDDHDEEEEDPLSAPGYSPHAW